MRRRPKRANESTIFELISDIALSSLGLFLIFFVVYTLIFNSVSITQIQKSNNLNMVISQLNQEKSQLNQEKSQLIDQNQELTKKLDNANNLAENAEQEKQLAIERNLYTGYYVGEFEGKFYYNGCNNDYEIIRQEHTLIYLQISNTMIYSTKSEKGTISYRINGTLQGNTFTGEYADYSRTENIEICDKEQVMNQQIFINFFSDRLEMYNSPNDPKFVLRKAG
jgi:hypothetical protein